MKSKIKYTNEPFEARVVRDFLPKPEDLVLREKKVKVTLALSQRSVDFFKKLARDHSTSYQAAIRRLLDYYVASRNL